MRLIDLLCFCDKYCFDQEEKFISLSHDHLYKGVIYEFAFKPEYASSDGSP